MGTPRLVARRTDLPPPVTSAHGYDLRTHATLLGAGLAEVTVTDGQPTVVVDDLFEAARRAALAGFDDADRERAARRARPDRGRAA